MEQKTDGQNVFSTWMNSAMSFWDQMVKMGAGTSADPAKSAKSPAQEAAVKSWETTGRIFKAALSSLSDPKNVDAMLKGADSIPEFMMNMGQQICESCFELQKQMIDRASKIGQQTKAYSFEDIDQEVFKSFREIYEKEFKKFFQIPQLGLTRFYQERSNRLMDKLNMFNTHLSEFVYLFYVPMEKATAVMQEKISLMAEKGELHDDIKVYYNNWVKILEGHYMTLLQSPEYTQALDNTIRSLVEYREAKDDLLSDVLQFFPIPTNKEMDALYKEFHVLKRRIRELSQKLEEIETGRNKA